MTFNAQRRTPDHLKTHGRSDMYPTHNKNYASEELKNLCNSIERYHLDFLCKDGHRKVESLRLLKAYATEFLCQIPHAQKFKFPAIESVLSQSIAQIPGFDPREAVTAYENLAKYADNLLGQPWRKEFHRMKINSGFFTHNVRASLMNPQEILILMGYVGTDDYTLELAGLPDTGTLIAVSRDCYVASQECLVLSQIFDRVRTELPEYSLTIREVYSARKSLIGETASIAKYLTHQIRSRYYATRKSDIGTSGRGASEHESYYDVVDGRRSMPSRSTKSSMPSSSGFKGLKLHQDLPKSAPTGMTSSSGAAVVTNGSGIFGKVKSRSGKPSKQDRAEVDVGTAVTAVGKRALALTRSKVPNDYDPDELDLIGSSILDRSTKSLVAANVLEESLYQNDDDRNSPVPSQTYLAPDTYYKTSSSSSPELTISLPEAAPAVWSCPHCTFHNTRSENICEVCAKSKDFVLEEEDLAVN